MRAEDMVVVTLTDHQMAAADVIAERRQKSAENRNNSYGKEFDPADDLYAHKVGCYGCKAFGLGFNVRWMELVDNFRDQPDLGYGGLVTRTRTKDWYDLLARDDDHNSTALIHVIWQPPHAVFVGWLPAGEAKLIGATMDPKNRKSKAVFVPNHKLRKMSELVELMHRNPYGPFLPAGFDPQVTIGFGGRPVRIRT